MCDISTAERLTVCAPAGGPPIPGGLGGERGVPVCTPTRSSWIVRYALPGAGPESTISGTPRGSLRRQDSSSPSCSGSMSAALRTSICAGDASWLCCLQCRSCQPTGCRGMTRWRRRMQVSDRKYIQGCDAVSMDYSLFNEAGSLRAGLVDVVVRRSAGEVGLSRRVRCSGLTDGGPQFRGCRESSAKA